MSASAARTRATALHGIPGLLGRPAEADEGLGDLAAPRLAPAGAGGARMRAGAGAAHRTDLVAQLEHEALGRLCADAGDGRQGLGVARGQRHGELVGPHDREHRQGQPRADAARRSAASRTCRARRGAEKPNRVRESSRTTRLVARTPRSPGGSAEAVAGVRVHEHADPTDLDDDVVEADVGDRATHRGDHRRASACGAAARASSRAPGAAPGVADGQGQGVGGVGRPGRARARGCG